MKTKFMQLAVIASLLIVISSCCNNSCDKHPYNGVYKGEYLNRVAFPIGGIGAGMFCWEGNGAISNMSLRHHPSIFHEPRMFGAIHVKGIENGTKVLEGPVQDWKIFGMPNSVWGGNGWWGLPRFDESTFQSRFPFATINLSCDDVPLKVEMKAWSPFIPTDEDNSSLPVGAIEYTFSNPTSKEIEAIFSYNSENFMRIDRNYPNSIGKMKNGYVLSQGAMPEKEHFKSDFAIFTDAADVQVDYSWFRGSWFDPLTMAWNNLSGGIIPANEPVEEDAKGASLFVPVNLKAGESKTIRIFMAWYVPKSDLRAGKGDAETDNDISYGPASGRKIGDCEIPEFYEPWYSRRFASIGEVASYWLNNYNELKKNSELFTSAFYDSSLPAEVLEAVSANLSILKSPTVMRQHDGRMWNWEGTGDDRGSCPGSCTHVWNYAQAVPHLFPVLERTLRETEFYVDQSKEGHQEFRANLPIRPICHKFYSAADGQMGGIAKVYRDWRISGDNEWMKDIYPRVKESMDYCIRTWDPRRAGIIDEPHHNTYDIEFWGANGMHQSFYATALQAVVLMGKAINDDVSQYEELLAKCKEYTENNLFDGEYFIQNIQWEGLDAPDPIELAKGSFAVWYSPEAEAILREEGPKYQYGKGCLSDGVLGCYMAFTAGMDEPIDREKVVGHLKSVHKYNFKKDLSDHANPQRPAYALGNEGGLLLCTWPKGGKLKIPFTYSNEVWTGIEYQVAAHLMRQGEVEKGLEIVRAARDRYDGRVRNPYNEVECGAWYARALASYAMLQGLTGVRYDAVDKTLYVDSNVGDFKSFLSTNIGFGTVELKNGKVTLTVYYGDIAPEKCNVSGSESAFEVKKI